MRPSSSLADLHAEANTASFWSREGDVLMQAKREELGWGPCPLTAPCAAGKAPARGGAMTASCAHRERMQTLYVYLVGLDRYIDLNREGFRKALKVGVPARPPLSADAALLVDHTGA